MNKDGIKKIFQIAPIKTLWFNFSYFPFKEACKIPVILARGVVVSCCHKGFCTLNWVKPGIVKIGFHDSEYNIRAKSKITIKGKLIINGSGFHSFGGGTVLGIGSEGVLTCGNNFSASFNNRIWCNCSITIGDDNMWSFANVVMDADAHQICDDNGNITNFNKPIVFGNHVWLGCHNIIMKGSEIADGCMIASGSKISGKYEEKNCIITTGKRIIKHNIFWKRDWSINKPTEI